MTTITNAFYPSVTVTRTSPTSKKTIVRWMAPLNVLVTQ